jgi:hypothetical protein
MEMKVKHALAAMHTGIDDETVPGIRNSLYFRDLGAGKHQMSKQSDIGILEICNRRHMSPGDDKRMSLGLGIDIVECDHQLVLIDERRGNRPLDDFAKEAFRHGVDPFLKPDFPNRIANS